MKVTGTIKREDLGPGVFLLVGDDGKTYALDGGDDKLRKAGQKVVVEGEIAKDAVGIGMTGNPTLRVKSWKSA